MSGKDIVKRWSVVLVLLLIMMSAVGCSKSPAPAANPAAASTVELKWYQPEPVGHPWTDVGQKICDDIAKASNGRIKVTQYPAGALGTQAEAVNMLRAGTLAMLTSGPSILASFYEPVQVFSLPYLFKDKEHAYKVLDSEIGQKIFNDTILKKSGVRTVEFWYFGDRTLTTGNLEVKKPEDLKGVKIRCMDTPVAKNVIAALGANPVPINFGELYMALQTGAVQGQENPIPTINAQKFYEVQKYIILTNHSVHMGTVHFSEQVWQKLSKEDQKLIMDAFKQNRALVDQKIIEQSNQALEAMKQKGVKVITPDVDAFRAYAKDFIQKTYGTNKEWMELFNSIQNFK